MTNKLTTVRLPHDLDSKLSELASDRMTSRASILRVALLEYLNNEDGHAKKNGKE